MTPHGVKNHRFPPQSWLAPKTNRLWCPSWTHPLQSHPKRPVMGPFPKDVQRVLLLYGSGRGGGGQAQQTGCSPGSWFVSIDLSPITKISTRHATVGSGGGGPSGQSSFHGPGTHPCQTQLWHRLALMSGSRPAELPTVPRTLPPPPAVEDTAIHEHPSAAY